MSVLCLIFAISCQTNDPEEVQLLNNAPNFEAYQLRYMHYPSNILPGSTGEKVTIQYDNQNRPIKREGGLLALPASTGFGYTFSNNYYEEVVYGNNEISLTVKLSLPYSTDQLKTIYKTQNGKIVKKINIDPYVNDTIEYFYNNEKVVQSFKKKKVPVSDTKYYYNSAGNIDSIVSRPYVFNAVSQTWQVDFSGKIRTVQLFKDYDNSPNPTKKLMLFEEIFNRSLSQNNYRFYESKSYDVFGNLYDFSTRSWTFNYVNNQIQFTN
ncbi:hypothetical protein [Chryseobacterium sp. Leaf394]|uniref:hypothetical protein n=1 Tax=Chryseobacterium sp. Leaf394 TaxID=1736361 RepID=UPI000FF895FC|nr:hypothetical protein [Chryseobacterium sp. Leaf394]